MSTEIINGLEAGKTYYLREADLAFTTWIVRLISGTPEVPLGSDEARVTFVDLDDSKEYVIYEQVGGIPAATDLSFGTLPIDTLAAIELQTTKAAIREAMSGRWTDETNSRFDLVVTETPAP